MKTYLKIVIATLALLFSINQVVAQDATKAHKDSLNTVVEKYYELNLTIFQANSTIENINTLFEIFTPDFEYVHPKYGGVYSRENLYNGYLRNQKNGSYDGKVTDIKIANKILGLNAVVVQRRYIEEEDGELQMTLFEFKDGKISRIFEYW
jgi:hypothetical protein